MSEVQPSQSSAQFEIGEPVVFEGAIGYIASASDTHVQVSTRDGRGIVVAPISAVSR